MTIVAAAIKEHVKDGEVVERFAGAGPERMYSEKLDYYLKGMELSDEKKEPETKDKQVVEEKK